MCICISDISCPLILRQVSDFQTLLRKISMKIFHVFIICPALRFGVDGVDSWNMLEPPMKRDVFILKLSRFQRMPHNSLSDGISKNPFLFILYRFLWFQQN